MKKGSKMTTPKKIARRVKTESNKRSGKTKKK